MNGEVPPPLPPAPRRWGRKIGIAAAILGTLAILGFAALVALRAAGLITFYRISSAAMVPAINRNDLICVEGITYRLRQPARGEVIVFAGDGLTRDHPGDLYTYRLVGLPGDQLRISGGTLYVNDQPSSLRNKAGEIRYTTGIGTHLRREDETYTVPAGEYFVLGDNSANSADSRLRGAVPARGVTGRAVFCYAPSADAGWIR